jgi:predicted nucleic acid-binding protein
VALEVPTMFQSVLVPPAVVAELRHRNTPELVKAWLSRMPPWLLCVAPTTTVPMPRLGAGETQAIALALENHADLLLADDGKARIAATKRVLAVAGTLSVLTLAAERGLIRWTEACSKLVRTNFYVVPELLEKITTRLRSLGIE